MKKKTATILSLILILAALCMNAVATETEAERENSIPDIRVNGSVVQFPDAQPYIDEHGRTMMPVRFVTEQLGAEVSWDGPTKTARISKNDVAVEITIGEANLLVTENGELRTEEMDTAAVLHEGRTYVPIRFVAEALGAYVDYSDVYRTVGIYNDALTTEQITALRAYPYTQSDGAVSYARMSEDRDADHMKFLYGSDRDSFQGENGYANSREHLYHCLDRICRYPFEAVDTILEGAENDEFFQTLVHEAVAEIGYSSDNLELQFLSDGSCMYQEDHCDSLTVSVRGIILMTCHCDPAKLKNVEAKMVCADCKFTQIYQGMTLAMPVDVHMNAVADYCVNINTIVPLDEPYEWEAK